MKRGQRGLVRVGEGVVGGRGDDSNTGYKPNDKTTWAWLLVGWPGDYLGQLPQPLQVTADFDIAVVTVPSQVVVFVHIYTVAAIGYDVEEEPLVVQRKSSIAGRLMVWA